MPSPVTDLLMRAASQPLAHCWQHCQQSLVTWRMQSTAESLLDQQHLIHLHESRVWGRRPVTCSRFCPLFVVWRSFIASDV